MLALNLLKRNHLSSIAACGHNRAVKRKEPHLFLTAASLLALSKLFVNIKILFSSICFTDKIVLKYFWY